MKLWKRISLRLKFAQWKDDHLIIIKTKLSNNQIKFDFSLHIFFPELIEFSNWNRRVPFCFDIYFTILIQSCEEINQDLIDKSQKEKRASAIYLLFEFYSSNLSSAWFVSSSIQTKTRKNEPIAHFLRRRLWSIHWPTIFFFSRHFFFII